MGAVRRTAHRHRASRSIRHRLVGGPAVPGGRHRTPGPGVAGPDPSVQLRGGASPSRKHPPGRAGAGPGLEQEAEAAARMTGRARSRLERALLDWLEAGGFPEVQGLDAATRRRLLRDYVDVAMLRDVVERHSVRNVAGLRWLVRHLPGNAGSPFSVEKFHGALGSRGIAVARDTLHRLLSCPGDCFLVRILWMESASERQRMMNPRKAYPVDPGLIPVFDRTGRANTGHALETVVRVGAGATRVRDHVSAHARRLRGRLRGPCAGRRHGARAGVRRPVRPRDRLSRASGAGRRGRAVPPCPQAAAHPRAGRAPGRGARGRGRATACEWLLAPPPSS